MSSSGRSSSGRSLSGRSLSGHRIMVFASNVAAAARLHKYKHPVEVVESMWRREARGESFRRARNTAISAGAEPEKIGTAEERIETLAAVDRRLKATIDTMVSTVTSEAVNEKITLQEAVSRAASATQRTLDTTKVTERANTNVTPEEIHELVRRRVHTQYGTAKEDDTVKRIEAAHQTTVTDNNDKFYTAYDIERAADGSWSLSLGGRIDGLVDGKLVEIKNRRSRFMTPLPLYDVVQVHVYMMLLGQREATLVEQLRNTSGTRTKETKVQWDASLWDDRVLVNLRAFAEAYARFLGDSKAQQDLLKLSRPEDKSYWWDNFSNYDKFEDMPVEE